MKSYFWAVDEEAGWTIAESRAHFGMLKLCILALTAARGTGIYDARGWLLFRYAAANWIEHLRKVDDATTDPATIITVLKFIHLIISNTNSALSKFERAFHRIRDGEESIKIFGPELSYDDGLEILMTWTHKAKNHQFYPGFLTPNMAEWVEEMSSNPNSLLLRLARGHIDNWLVGNVNSSIAEDFCSFSWARSALRLAFNRGLPAVCDNEQLRPYFDKTADPPDHGDGIYKAVASIGTDINPSASVSVRISHAARAEDRTREAVLIARKAVEQAEGTFEKYNAQGDLGRYLAELGGLRKLFFLIQEDQREPAEDIETDQALLEQALEALGNALSLGTSLLKDSQGRKDLEMDFGALCTSKAQAEVLLGKFKESADTLSLGARTCKTWDLGLLLVFSGYRAAGEWRYIVEALKVLGQPAVWTQILNWVDDVHLTLHQAVMKTGEQGFLVSMYESCIKECDAREPTKVRSLLHRLQLAQFYKQSIGDYAKAKTLLLDVIETKVKYLQSFTQESWVLTDVLLEQFRRSHDLQEKTSLLEEMQRLRDLVYDRNGSDFEPYSSQIIIPYAHMLRQVGSAAEYQVTIETIFRGCVRTLTDTQLENDVGSFCMLARVLSQLPGLETEAQIAFSCIFYIVDMDLLRSGTANPRETAEASEGGPAAEPTQATTEPPLDVDSYDLDTTEGNTHMVCDGCNRSFQNWNAGSIYLCTHCTNVDLCAECYDKKMAVEQGTTKPDWRVVCPVGHKYVRGPVDGWKGVKDGVLYIKDTPPLRFRAWLDDLKEAKWKAAWERYWQSQSF